MLGMPSPGAEVPHYLICKCEVLSYTIDGVSMLQCSDCGLGYRPTSSMCRASATIDRFQESPH